KRPRNVPDNVFFQSMTIDEINKSIRDRLGFDSRISHPYKLCDIKPAYGMIFREFIQDFDYWGYGDIDVVYGDLSKWLTSNTLSCDIISFRKKWLSGSLTLIRNSDSVNQLFLESPDVKRVFESPDHFEFDEVSRCWFQIRTMPIEEISFPYDNFTRVVHDASKKGRVRVRLGDYAKESIPSQEYLLINEGRLVDQNGTEYAYYHFITEKRKRYFYYPKWPKVPAKYVIDCTGFYTLEGFKHRKIAGILRKIRWMPLVFVDVLRRVKRKFSTPRQELTL